ncbi:MAG: alkaline phosphatase family protein [Leptospiraceae bacterium]|nr:alkaline phosphatase family protein [Leptospiraceae bacterium]
MNTGPVFRIGIVASILFLSQVFPAQSMEGAPFRDPVPRARAIQDIAFGSCLRQERPAPILESIAQSSPDLFIFLGDNVYADTTSENVMNQAYRKLWEKEGFQKLRKKAELHAIWDDHDYGANDAGGEFTFRKQSERIFKQFWQIADRSPYQDREGVYASFLYRSAGAHPIKVQLILLDTRSFRSPWTEKPWWKGILGLGNSGPYVPDRNQDLTILGKEQWEWLRHQFTVQADLRIVASSIQVLSAADGWETWSNLPLEKERLLDLAAGQPSPVVFISGDRHFAEISALRYRNRVFYDVTSSSLNQPLDFGDEENPLRRGERFTGANFGRIRINDSASSWNLELQILDEKGRVVLNERYVP